MRTISSKQLEEILRSHKKWLNGENGVRVDLCEVNLREVNLCKADLCRADLRGANLYGADLREADLCGADLRKANLYEANLCNVNLREADLREADLCRADLRDLDLREANLRDADLRWAYLCRANLREVGLRGANLYGAILYRADFCGADLREVNLRGANLRWTNLRWADLRGANLYGADLREAIIDMDVFNKICPLRCPETGAFIGWKKVDGHIVKLEIPEDALRSSATTNRCRCSKVKILAIENLDGSVADVRKVSSDYDSSLMYEVGKTVEVKNFDRDRKNEYAPGIHFFCTRQEAVDY